MMIRVSHKRREKIIQISDFPCNERYAKISLGSFKNEEINAMGVVKFNEELFRCRLKIVNI
jgi:hypothetical protein